MYINGASHYLPATTIHNDRYECLAGVSDDWIRKRSGIRSRTRANCRENTNTMAIEACKGGIGQIPYSLKEVDLIVGATYTPYDTIATLAHAVQNFFEVRGARAISTSSACSSFINAIEVVEGYFATGKAHKAIVVASEHNSTYSDDTDTQCGHLWGDGAGAVFISQEKKKFFVYFLQEKKWLSSRRRDAERKSRLLPGKYFNTNIFLEFVFSINHKL